MRAFGARGSKKALDFKRKIGVSALDAYRLAFSEADFLPGLIVDKFGDYIAMQVLTLGVERVKDAIVKNLDRIISREKHIPVILYCWASMNLYISNAFYWKHHKL